MDENHNYAVVGLAINLTWNDTRPFVLSLREAGYKGDIIFFQDRLDSATAERYSKFGVYTLPFTLQFLRPWHGRMLRALIHFYGQKKISLRQGYNWAARTYSHRNVARFFFYEDWLSVNLGRYESILLADVRDVIFQQNPFSECKGRQLVTFTENNLIGSCSYHKRWFEQSLGIKKYQSMAHLPILCAGITIGTSEKIYEYISTMNDYFYRFISTANIDQAIHNWIFHQKIISGTTIEDYSSGWVANIGTMPEERLHLEKNSILVDKDKAPAVIHQYDRHPILRSYVYNRYNRA